MNQNSLMSMAFLTNKVSSNQGIFACSIPGESISFRATTFPTRVIFSTFKFRQPFSFTPIITKRLVAMKTAGRAGNIFTTPRARMSFRIASTLIWSTPFSFLGTFPRAILLRTLACAYCWITTYRTLIRFTNTKSSQFFTLIRTVSLGWLGTPAIKWVKVLATTLAFHNRFASHIYIIPQQIVESKYCEIATKRLSQSVMKLDT